MISRKIDIEKLRKEIKAGNFLSVARALTLVENNIQPAEDLLKSLDINSEIPVIGITGPPGAGKSTLVNAIIAEFSKKNKKVAVLAVDPTSPFNFGSLLGDRIRMTKHFNNEHVFIRSVATRGSLGGMSAKTIEMTDVLRSANFDLIIIETVGVGQSEIEVAGLADQTILVLVPEAGDEIQHIKSGLMEVAQAFVVNKADREGADVFANRLKKMVDEQHQETPVFKTVADKQLGVDVLCEWIENIETNKSRMAKDYLFAEHAYRLIQTRRMFGVDKGELLKEISRSRLEDGFNLYGFIEKWI
ncbi:MAG: methylmalonyl Co-A mutase-associated GTPase MeaB [Pedobacter sp.]|uniref:methylmalonyl Co-A mutase-associated GTPase MeaB n=1 Tax=Pedobacter sp. TaxID=1411316 RepID=UPI002807D11B|nr:methylmalonyl Co-A mutase-associated GTPase MeaB [Pedobacter sp.]MDQ8004971.1 methylmalonyl Co-A mutase-associated GTPase MeaB [Pedobacter sp.]